LKSFIARIALALCIGLVAAIIVAPAVAMAVAAAGWRFPFPRIFDRTMMVTLLLAIIWLARDLNFVALLRSGFRHPAAKSAILFVRGLAVSLCTIAILFTLAIMAGHGGVSDLHAAASRIPKYLLSAIVIAIVEEAFFRAFILGGLKTDFGNRTALLLSSAIYAVAHLVRSPARFYVSGFVPTAGLSTLAHSLDQLSHANVAIPTLIGLFLLGVALGAAYLVTGSVYFSIGMHCGFVLGAKLWPKVVLHRAIVPWWIAGPGPVPLIAAPPAWCFALAILLMLRPLTGVKKSVA
jgi:membrane protease YdiL (CAAX protease family)